MKIRNRFSLFAVALTLTAGSGHAAILSTSQTIPDPILDPFFPVIGTFVIDGDGQTFTDSFGAAFDPFDTSLGTLIEARLSYFTLLQSIGDVMDDDPSFDASFTASLTTQLEASDFATGIIAQDSDIIGPDLPLLGVESVSLNTGLSGGVTASDLSPFLGTDPILVRLTNGFDFSGTNVEFNALADQTAELTITYVYDTSPPPVVPLPAGGVLLLSGMAGFAALRRRAARV